LSIGTKNIMSNKSFITYGKEVIATEIEAINRLSNNLSTSLDEAVEYISNCRGRIVLSGMGKSGLVAKKISATLSSTGTPSFFLHPAEALHGDLGMIRKEDVVLSISNSGESEEIIRLIPFIKSQGIIHITMTGNMKSSMAKNADVILDISINKEACPLQLAPMSSTTCTLVMGDVIAACLMKKSNFQPENFAKFHPAGALGRRLLSTVADEMKTEDLPLINPESSIKELIFAISHGHLGLVVVEKEGEVLGLITDGDLRRALEKYDATEFFNLSAKEIMTPQPVSVSPETKIIEVEKILKERKIKAILVIDNRQLKGIFEYNGII